MTPHGPAPAPAATRAAGRARHVRGLLLAAGAGRRMGGPKALVRPTPDAPTLVEQGVELLLAGGCSGVTVVVGAAGEEVTAIVQALGHDVDVVDCPEWSDGMGASLRAGLAAVARRPREGEGVVDAVLVSLVDLPDLTPEVVTRVLGTHGPRHDVPAEGHGTGHAHGHDTVHEGRSRAVPRRRVLRRAVFEGVPGHPALIGRDHWEEVVRVATGDQGARDHFRTHPHDLVECGDLASGRDADTPRELSGRDASASTG